MEEPMNPELRLTPELKQILIEYYLISIRNSTAERDAARIQEILNLAAVSEPLDFWLSEIDSLLEARIGYLGPEPDPGDAEAEKAFLTQQSALLIALYNAIRRQQNS